MNASQQSIETGVAMTAKAAPPVTVSIATVAGVPVDELVLWATLIYTILMIAHKLYSIYVDFAVWRGGKDRRTGASDERPLKIDRRARDA